MKFHWGTGITIFLLLFLGAAAVFISFAMRQDVDLVHEDYYERGVDHNDMMEVKARSEAHAPDIGTRLTETHLLVTVRDSLALQMDSASFLLFRPSDARLDLEGAFLSSQNPMALPLKNLSAGRYILIFQWHRQGLRYETQQSILIP